LRNANLKTLSLFLFSSVAAFQANAGDYYWELGLGGGQYNNTGYGAAANFVFAKNLSKTSSGFQFHLGLKDKYSTGTGAALNMVYPLIRFETRRVYLSGGASPLGYLKSTGSYERISGIGFFGELGLLWRVVPFFHLALEGSAEMLSAGVGPNYAATVQWRFIWFNYESSSRKGEFDGWRYPFGTDIWDK
jgi:hypothetical protein